MGASFLRRPFDLGSLKLPSNIFCAPLAGCSDLPFRQMTSSYQPGMVFCEMTKMEALIRHDAHTYRLLDYDRSMHPIGAQLCGANPKIAGECARIIEDLGFDAVDYNCGCPVDKVTKDGSGSGMLKNPRLVGEVLSEMVAAVKIPVTVKVRAGWDENSIVAPEITQIAEQAGAKIIFVHGRTRSQGYTGPANWDYIRACKQVAKTIQVFGNGDVVDALSAERLFQTTGCDGILVARGTFGQAWLIEDIYRHLSGQPPLLRRGNDLKEELLHHLTHVKHYQNERRALIDLRRIGAWYFRKGQGVKQLRDGINHASNLSQVLTLIENYSWEEVEVG